MNRDADIWAGIFGTSKGKGTNIGTAPGTDTPIKKPSSTRKYQCPLCKKSVRATREVNIMCMDCNTQMLKV